MNNLFKKLAIIILSRERFHFAQPQQFLFRVSVFNLRRNLFKSRKYIQLTSSLLAGRLATCVSRFYQRSYISISRRSWITSPLKLLSFPSRTFRFSQLDSFETDKNLSLLMKASPFETLTSKAFKFLKTFTSSRNNWLHHQFYWIFSCSYFSRSRRFVCLLGVKFSLFDIPQHLPSRNFPDILSLNGQKAFTISLFITKHCQQWFRQFSFSFLLLCCYEFFFGYFPKCFSSQKFFTKFL